MELTRSRYGGLAEYFTKILSIQNQTSLVELGCLTVLSEQCKQDENEEFRKAAISAGVVQRLTNILNNPFDYFKKNNQFKKQTSLLKSNPNSDDAVVFVDNSHSPYLPLQSFLALSSLQLFCSVRMSNAPKFVDEPLLRCLLRYVSPHSEPTAQPYGNFFQYSPDFTDILKRFVKSSKTDMKMSSNWDKRHNIHNELAFYEPTVAEIADVQLKSSNVLYVAIKKGSNSQNDLSKKLVDKDFAWERCPELGDASQQEEGVGKAKETLVTTPTLEDLKWKTCRITNVLSGNFLWALIGADAIETTTAISTSLKDDFNCLKKVKPNINDLVAVALKSDGSEDEVIRARVVAMAGGVVTVFAMDSGVISKVPIHCVYSLPSHLNLEEIPATASLVRLKGIVPQPLDVRSVELALASLVSVCKWSVFMGNRLVDRNILSQLPDLIHSPDHHVSCQALRLAAQLVYGKSRPCCDQWLKILFATLVVLHKCVQRRLQHVANCSKEKSLPEADQTDTAATVTNETNSTMSRSHFKEIITCGLTLLANRLFMSRDAKSFFFRVQGLDVVMHVFALSQRDSRLRQLAILVFANFVHVTRVRADMLGLKHPSTNNTNDSKFSQQRELHEAQAQEEDSDEEDLDDPCVLENKSPSDYIERLDSDGVIMDMDRCLKNGDLPYYVLDSTVPFRSDSSHELHQSASLRFKSLATVVCGMLNTGHEGSIFLGISENGQVKGETLTHELRDEIRLGVDQVMMSKLIPTVLHSQFRVNCTPVVRWVGEDDNRHVVNCADQFVIEIWFQPVPKVIYCCNNDESYYRVGSTTMKLSQQDVRHMIVNEEETWHKETIESLQKELAELKELEAQL